MRRTFMLGAWLLAAGAFLAACGNDSFAPQQPPHQVQSGQAESVHQAAPAPPAPVPATAPPAQDSGFSWGSAIVGAVAGYALSNATAPAPQVVTREVPRYISRPAPRVPSTPAVKPSPAPAFAAPKAPAPTAPAAPKPTVVPKFTAPAPSRYSGPSGYSSVTQSRPSYSSTPSRSSRR